MTNNQALNWLDNSFLVYTEFEWVVHTPFSDPTIDTFNRFFMWRYAEMFKHI